METVFSLSGLLVMPFWTLMIFLLHWRWTHRILWSPLVILPPALLYAALALPRLAEVFQAVSNPTLAGSAALLGTASGSHDSVVALPGVRLVRGTLDLPRQSRAWHRRPPHGSGAVPDPDAGANRILAVPGLARRDRPILRR